MMVKKGQYRVFKNIVNEESIKNKIINWLQGVKTPVKMADCNTISERLGIEPEKLQFMVYDLFAKFLQGGKSKGKMPGNATKEQIESGIKEEMEHTDNYFIARKIVADHLTEDLDYYNKLES
jgi:hypothetical protein